MTARRFRVAIVPLVGLALLAGLLAHSRFWERPEVVARDRFGAITRNDVEQLLARPGAWMPDLAEAVGLAEAVTPSSAQEQAAARYLSIARQLRSLYTGPPIDASPAVEAVLEQARQDQLLRILEEDIEKQLDDIGPHTIERYHQTHLHDFTDPAKRRFRSLFVRTGQLTDKRWRPRTQAAELIQAVRDEVARGAPFAALVPVVTDSQHEEPTGLIGPVALGDLDWEIEDVLWSLEPGEISRAVETVHGMHLLQLVEAIPETPRPLQEVEDEVVAAIIADRQEAEALRLEDIVAKEYLLEFNPENAYEPPDSQALVLFLDEDLYTRAACEAWFDAMSEQERELYRTPERKAARILENCNRLIRLRAARVLNTQADPRFQRRMRRKAEAVRLSAVFAQHLQQAAQTQPEITPAELAMAILREAGFQGAQ